MKLIPLAKIEKYSREHTLSMILIILDRMPKKRLAKLLYSLNKMQLPEFRTARKQLAIKRKTLPSIHRRLFLNNPPYEIGEKEFVKGKWQNVKRKTKRKFSRKQLAAQRLFAKRARAGTLKRRRR